MKEDPYYEMVRREEAEARVKAVVKREIGRDNKDLRDKARYDGSLFFHVVTLGAPARAADELERLFDERIAQMKSTKTADGITQYEAAIQQTRDHIHSMGGYDSMDQHRDQSQLWKKMLKEEVAFQAPGLQGREKDAFDNRLLGGHIARLEKSDPKKFESLKERFIGTRRTESNPAISERDAFMNFVGQKSGRENLMTLGK